MSATPVFIASVPTGLESIAADEAVERLPDCRIIEKRRGRIILSTPATHREMRRLRTVFRWFAFVGRAADVPAAATGPEHLRRSAETMDWDAAVDRWRAWWSHGGAAKNDPPHFRVTASRFGEHAYTSMDLMRELGAMLNARYAWPVRLKEPDLEVDLQLHDGEALLGIVLTPRSLHHDRNWTAGPTGLKAPIAAAVARLLAPQPGERIVDPLCGSGALPIETAILEPRATVLAGDQEAALIDMARHNAAQVGAAIEASVWDARHVPLEEASVDAIITDLPFGVRVGSHTINRHLYPALMREFTRLVRPGGRAVVLTLERRLFQRLVDRAAHWTLREHRRVTYGGIDPSVYLLTRKSRMAKPDGSSPMLRRHAARTRIDDSEQQGAHPPARRS